MNAVIKSSALVYALAAALLQLPAWAQDAPAVHHHRIDWDSLHLTSQQSEQIQTLQSDWNSKYLLLAPQIHKQKEQLQELFDNPQSDPLDIVSTQQSVTRLQEQLRSDATASYLRKRAVLSDLQKRQLESQLHEMVLEHQQRRQAESSQQAEEPGGMMSLMEKVRWALGPH